MAVGSASIWWGAVFLSFPRRDAESSCSYQSSSKSSCTFMCMRESFSRALHSPHVSPSCRNVRNPSCIYNYVVCNIDHSIERSLSLYSQSTRASATFLSHSTCSSVHVASSLTACSCCAAGSLCPTDSASLK